MIKYKDLEGIFHSKGEKDAHELYKQRFAGEATYVLGIYIDKYEGFCVNNREVFKLIDEINEYNLELNKLTEELPNISIKNYIKKCLIDEIKITGEIEGVSSTRKEINAIIEDIKNSDKSTERKRLYGLVQKYLKLIKNEDIALSSCEDIRALYEDLVWTEIEQDDPENLPDGEIFRKGSVNVIDSTQKVVHKGINSESKIVDYMNKLINILYNKDYNYLVRVAVVHYLLGYIHPFYDGNGRLSRFISSYMLSKKLNPLVAYSISYTIKENIKTYYKMFKETNKVKNMGEMTFFVINFLNLIKISMERMIEELETKKGQLNFYLDRLGFFLGEQEEFKNIKIKREICWILIQNELFGEKKLPLSDIGRYLEPSISESNLRLHMKGLSNILTEEREGRIKVYGIDLSCFE